MNTKRFQNLLLKYGRTLGFECSVHGSSIDWKTPALSYRFQLDAEVIGVIAYTPFPPDGTIPESSGPGGILGTATYAELKAALNGTYIPPTPLPAVPRNFHAEVVSNAPACQGHYLLTLTLPYSLYLSLYPGQFFHVTCDSEGEDGLRVPLTLRRPFSIHNIEYYGFNSSGRKLLATDLPAPLGTVLHRSPTKVSILYKILGAGTQALSRVQPGQTLDVLGPIGNGFEMVGAGQTAVLVAGGIGAAPLTALAEALRFRGARVHLYVGALTHDYLGAAVCRPDQCYGENTSDDSPEFARMIVEECAEIGIRPEDVHICTDDGSAGERGFVTEVLERHLRDGTLPGDSTLYACGPHGMLGATARIAERYGVECQVSMEERMACGVGACMSCVCSTVAAEGVERKRVCKDGPVFSAREIAW